MADCSAVRSLFIKRSGRKDLVNANGTDNGANSYLNRGIRLLDGRMPLPHNERRHVVQVEAGTWFLKVMDFRILREVWCATSDGKWSLTPLSMGQLRKYYPTGSFGDVETGTPCYYAVGLGSLTPELSTKTATDFDGVPDTSDLLYGDDPAVYNGVIWMPPCDETTTVSLWGTWYTASLSADDDLNWWTANHPDLVVLAALYRLECDYRNTEGASDYLAQINNDLQPIDFDLAEQESARYTKIEG